MKRIETIKKNCEVIANEYYTLDNLISDAKQYISAIKQGRMIVNVESVSRSGMTRKMNFYSCEGKGKHYRYRSYLSLFEALGQFTVNKDNQIVVGGCGMNMIFHVNYTTIRKLYNLGFITIKECRKLEQQTPTYC